MKKATIIIALAATLAGCTTTRNYEPLPERTNYEFSWCSFCESRGYDVADRNGQAYDEYLDTWVGSTEEETALINAGVEL